MGREPIGVVEDIGSAVRRVKQGDLVLMPFAFFDGTCDFCHEDLNTALIRKCVATQGFRLHHHARRHKCPLHGDRSRQITTERHAPAAWDYALRAARDQRFSAWGVRNLLGMNARNMNLANTKTPTLNTTSPGTLAQTSACISGLCMNSAERA